MESLSYQVAISTYIIQQWYILSYVLCYVFLNVPSLLLFGADEISGSDNGFILLQEAVGFAFIRWQVNLHILELGFTSATAVLTLGVRTSMLPRLECSHTVSISYCGLSSDSLNAMATLDFSLTFESDFCFSVFLKRNEESTVVSKLNIQNGLPS